MGSISGEFLLSGLRFTCSGHQRWLANDPMAALVSCTTGHLAGEADASIAVVSSTVILAPLAVPWLGATVSCMGMAIATLSGGLAR